MQFGMIGMALSVRDPAACAAWFAEHFGFTVTIDLGWYVNTQRDGHPNVSLDFLRYDHESLPPSARGREVSGTLLAFLVDDVDTEFTRLGSAGLEVTLPPVTEPWGQRRFQLAGPEGVMVEVLQPAPPDPAWLAANGLAR